MPEQRIRFDLACEPVNLAAPSRVMGGRLPAIEAIQDRLSRQLRVDLFGYLRYGVQIKNAKTVFELHDDVMRSFKPPVLVGVVSIAPLRGFSVIAIDGSLIGAVVDRLCGASSPSANVARDDFSAFEMRIAKNLIEVIQDSLTHAWQGVASLRIELMRTEVNTSFIAIADSKEPLITMRLEVEMATGSGQIVVAIPYPAVEPIRDKLATAAALTETRDEDQRQWQWQMLGAIERASTSVRAELVNVNVPVNMIERLAPGDVLPIRVPSCAKVYAGKVPIFEADFGHRNNVMALRIKHFLDSGNAEQDSDSTGKASNEHCEQPSERDRDNHG